MSPGTGRSSSVPVASLPFEIVPDSTVGWLELVVQTRDTITSAATRNTPNASRIAATRCGFLRSTLDTIGGSRERSPALHRFGTLRHHVRAWERVVVAA